MLRGTNVVSLVTRYVHGALNKHRRTSMTKDIIFNCY